MPGPEGGPLPEGIDVAEACCCSAGQGREPLTAPPRTSLTVTTSMMHNACSGCHRHPETTGQRDSPPQPVGGSGLTTTPIFVLSVGGSNEARKRRISPWQDQTPSQQWAFQPQCGQCHREATGSKRPSQCSQSIPGSHFAHNCLPSPHSPSGNRWNSTVPMASKPCDPLRPDDLFCGLWGLSTIVAVVSDSLVTAVSLRAIWQSCRLAGMRRGPPPGSPQVTALGRHKQ